MKISQLQGGEPCTVQLEAGSAAPPALAKAKEVRLLFPRSGDDAILSFDSVTIPVAAANDASRRSLTTLRETDPARLAWVVARRAHGSTAELTVQVHRFSSRLEWTDKISFAVDERVVDRVAKMSGRPVNAEKACQWLAEQVLLPPLGQNGKPRAIATGSPDKQKRFRLLGTRVGVDIEMVDDSPRVRSVVTMHGGRRDVRPPEILIESELEFVDATIAGKMRHSVRAQIERIIAETDSYIALWEKYQKIETGNLLRRAKEIGWVSYRKFEACPNGLWKFEVSDADVLRRFQGQLGAAGQEDLEADYEVPRELLEDARELDGRDRDERRRAPVGTVEAIRADHGVVFLRPLDEDSDVLPPKKGFLLAALQGDRIRLERREQAVTRIKSADARMPQMALILEGKNPYVRRTDRVPAFTTAARKAFDHDPTPEQRRAIDLAVNTPDIVVIQGPPGTGKTKVITAIEARLAELEEERPEVAGRTLLTSFQHDAVDHAVSKSLVFGLPPVRFGGRRGDRASADAQLERWAATAREHLAATLDGLPKERPLALYRTVRDRVAAYVAGGMPEDELRELLRQLVELPAGQLPTDLWERLRELHRGPVRGAGGMDLERELMRKSVRGLRTTAEAFADDGPRKARQTLERLEPVLAQEEKELLERAAATEPGAVFAELDVLEALRDTLLDRLNPDDVSGERRRVDLAVVSALNAAVTALHERMRKSVGGVADALEEYAGALRQDPRGVRALLEHYSAVYAATCQQAVSRHVVSAKGGEHIDLEFENVIVDEAARANPLDLFIPMSLAKRRIILVGDHRQLPHLLDPDVERSLSGTVHEQEQHALSESLFERLFKLLPGLRKNDEIIRIVTLRDQFRMHPVLGKFVSDVFYEPYGEGFRSPLPAEDFAHDLAGYCRAGRPVCAAWRNVPSREGAERAGRSKARTSEARWIAQEVKRLLADAHANLSIGVISFYRAQVDEILEQLVRQEIAERDPDGGTISIAPQWRTLERQDGTREERLRVGTVDAFQGKEFDVVFLSVTRSNAFPARTEEERRRKFGHLMLENRLCVAMSRQRRLLVAVGDKAMFELAEAREAVPGLVHFLKLCGGEDGLVL